MSPCISRRRAALALGRASLGVAAASAAVARPASAQSGFPNRPDPDADPLGARRHHGRADARPLRRRVPAPRPAGGAGEQVRRGRHPRRPGAGSPRGRTATRWRRCRSASSAIPPCRPARPSTRWRTSPMSSTSPATCSAWWCGPRRPGRPFAEFLDHAKRNPGKVNYGTPGAGTSLHITMEQIAEKRGLDWTHVPFRGAAENMQALLGGQIDAAADSSGWAQLVQDGKLRLLVTWGEERAKRFPEVPTLRETGIDIVSASPYGIAGPKGMDPGVVRVLHDAFKEALYDPIAPRRARPLRHAGDVQEQRRLHGLRPAAGEGGRRDGAEARPQGVTQGARPAISAAAGADCRGVLTRAPSARAARSPCDALRSAPRRSASPAPAAPSAASGSSLVMPMAPKAASRCPSRPAPSRWRRPSASTPRCRTSRPASSFAAASMRPSAGRRGSASPRRRSTTGSPAGRRAARRRSTRCLACSHIMSSARRAMPTQRAPICRRRTLRRSCIGA